MKYIYIFITIGFMLLASCTNDQKKKFTELPIHPEAINPQHFSDRIAEGVTSLTYKIKTPFPAGETINFIENSILNKGFTRYNMPYHALPSFKWSDYNSQTGEWKETAEIPARYSASWINESKNGIIWIVMEYSRATKIEDWQNKAHVALQIASLSKYKEELETLNKLTYNNSVQMNADQR